MPNWRRARSDIPNQLAASMVSANWTPRLRWRRQAGREDAFSCRRDQPPAKHRPPEMPGRTDRKEHTSELQSLMRRSYAVFCLKTTMKNYFLTNSYICQDAKASTSNA